MKKPVIGLFLAMLLLLAIVIPQAPQTSADDPDEDLWKVLTQLNTTTSFMNTGAHPDDERSHLLAYLSLKEGVRTGSMIANRGEGGQNEIGQELGNGLGIIRSEELIEASAVTNVDLMMLSQDLDDPIYDFGFSKTTEETLDEWGEELTYERLIRAIREYRPEIVFPSFLDVDTQHGHHRAITVLSLKAFDDAADPSVFPEHQDEGLEPWQIKKMYLPAEDVNDPTLSIEVGNEVDPVYGMTYAQLGEESRYLHKSQGMGRDLAVEPLYVHLDLVKSVNEIPDQEESIYEGLDVTFKDTAENLEGKNNQIRGALLHVHRALEEVIEQYPDRGQTLLSAHEALSEVEKTKDRVKDRNIDQELKDELLFKLTIKEDQLAEVSRVASSLEVEVDVENPTLTKGGTTTAVVRAENKSDQTLNDVDVDLNVPADWEVESTSEKVSLEPGEGIESNFEVQVPEGADFFHPYHPSVLTANVSYDVNSQGAAFVAEPEDTVAVLPDVAAQLTPDQVSINQLDVPENIDVEMTLTNYVDGATEVTPSLDVPDGWAVSASEETVQFSEQLETQTVSFTLTPPEQGLDKNFEVVGQLDVNERTFETTVQTIDYDHIDKSYYVYDAVASGIAFDLALPEDLKVGYIESGFDRIPEYLHNIGMDITSLSDEEIAEGDLSEYDSIALGIRAFRGREGLAEQNDRLLEYVENGGHLVVQYHTPNDSWDGQTAAPYPIEIGVPSIRWRVTDKNADVNLFDPEHELFNYPNAIEDSDWDGWVQERALYFPMGWDDRYETFISMADPGEEPYTSGILMAEYGEGTYMHTNLVWYRQIQGQVPGGYRIFTNLLSYPLSQE
ncbi:PIG-L family deacetylase [Alteribacter populi]|uniref:PIG-L family deacetylase n=1 Tax=Alteribacter populi TaxID=2011011 RepID=UPI000BBB0A21|nr:PIG-L family deacetylase [Alteribacter populi]